MGSSDPPQSEEEKGGKSNRWMDGRKGLYETLTQYKQCKCFKALLQLLL